MAASTVKSAQLAIWIRWNVAKTTHTDMTTDRAECKTHF